MNKKLRAIAAVLLGISFPFTVTAQDRVEAFVGADLVSGYIWRGQDLGNVSIQPSFNLTYKGFYLNAWGSVGFDKKDTKEIDLTFGYSIGEFSISITDYWINSPEYNYFHYGAHSTSHVFEAQVGYDFGLLAVNWYTNFAGADGLNKEGNRAYSSYFTINAPFKLGGIHWDAEMGVVPWETDFYNATENKWGTSGFAVTDISLKASKDIKITKSFALPIFAKVTANPCIETAYFTFGLTF